MIDIILISCLIVTAGLGIEARTITTLSGKRVAEYFIIKTK